ncbi:nitroreductase family deazaflavin-dependent oxidoreductase [Streptomyces sp. NPDC044571]|uniref:nitroreductase family deazaflavin-dependent oxidoreductase n=1 Tax=Streptomyces sp. NPDC044571 TaxID=3155371 RepID=UPI003400A3BB
MQTVTIDWDHPADPKPVREREHVRDYVTTGGLDGHLWHGVPTLLLTTVHRATGRTVRTPLIYAEDGGRHLVVAAGWGAADHPAWYRNLTAHPEVRLQVGPAAFQATARTACPVERDAYWPAMTALWPLFDDYRAAAAPRELPLVIIESLS